MDVNPGLASRALTVRHIIDSVRLRAEITDLDLTSLMKDVDIDLHGDLLFLGNISDCALDADAILIRDRIQRLVKDVGCSSFEIFMTVTGLKDLCLAIDPVMQDYLSLAAMPLGLIVYKQQSTIKSSRHKDADSDCGDSSDDCATRGPLSDLDLLEFSKLSEPFEHEHEPGTSAHDLVRAYNYYFTQLPVLSFRRPALDAAFYFQKDGLVMFLTPSADKYSGYLYAIPLLLWTSHYPAGVCFDNDEEDEDEDDIASNGDCVAVSDDETLLDAYIQSRSQEFFSARDRFILERRNDRIEHIKQEYLTVQGWLKTGNGADYEARASKTRLSWCKLSTVFVDNDNTITNLYYLYELLVGLLVLYRLPICPSTVRQTITQFFGEYFIPLSTEHPILQTLVGQLPIPLFNEYCDIVRQLPMPVTTAVCTARRRSLSLTSSSTSKRQQMLSDDEDTAMNLPLPIKYALGRLPTRRIESLELLLAGKLGIDGDCDQSTVRRSVFSHCRKLIDDSIHGADAAKKELAVFVTRYLFTASHSKATSRGMRLCVQGPPGVGKTTLIVQGLAACLGRPCVKINLATIGHASSLTGQLYAYYASSYGKIAAALIESNCLNPIIIIEGLDRIDRTTCQQQYASCAELVETLTRIVDPSRNTAFVDAYFGEYHPLDLSDCIIVFECISASMIPDAIRSYLDTTIDLFIGGMSHHVKTNIITNRLVPRHGAAHGLAECDMKTISEELISLLAINSSLTMNDLDKLVSRMCRNMAFGKLDGVESVNESAVTIDEDGTHKREQYDRHRPHYTIGSTYALGVLPDIGIGTILPIECSVFYSAVDSMSVHITGIDGHITRESVYLANTIAISMLSDHDRQKWLSKSSSHTYCLYPGIHVHSPYTATVKDGPSAGLAVVLAILSVMRDKPLRQDVVATGEIRARGKLISVGGLAEKLSIVANHPPNSMFTTILCPLDNVADLLKFTDIRELDNVGHPTVGSKIFLYAKDIVIYCFDTIEECFQIATSND